ncbi:D-2-hydroxyacid dehydrogenase [bacterium]|nr:MAG: D-2-hydroxyacid dehydrogenase [bacterium]
MAPLTIWCNLDLPEEAVAELRRGTEGHRVILGSEAPDDADVAFGQPPPDSALALPSLRWIGVTSAGYTRYDTPGFRESLHARDAVLSNSSSVFDEPCAQHLLAMMLAFARQLPEALRDQFGERRWPADRIRSESWLLQDQTVVIVGYGAIARRFIELAAPFGLRIMALRRHVRGDELVPTYPIEELGRLLGEADHLANILPANASTDGLLDADRFAATKPGACFYNIGRGTTVDQNALIAALESGQLSAAFLDVTDPEPLPSEHPLWSAPNCFITPHSAGGHRGEWSRLVRHFLQNLRRFESGEELKDRVI